MGLAMLKEEELQGLSKDYNTNFVTLRKNLKFSGRTLEEWTVELSIKFPDEISYAHIEELSQELDKAVSIAHNNLIVSEGMLNFLKRSLEIEEMNAHEEVNTQLNGAKCTVSEKDRMIMAIVKEAKDKVVVADFIHTFWEESCKLLAIKNERLKSSYWLLRTANEIV